MTYQDLLNTVPVTLVEVYATWCPHCRKMMPIVEQIKELLEGRAQVVQFDIDQNEELADDQNVQSVPTFILYSDSKEVWRHSGEIDAEALLGKVEKYLK